MRSLRRLLTMALEQSGCGVEQLEENLLRVAIPRESDLRGIFDAADAAYLALVDIEDDRLAGLDPVRRLVPGSIYLERFVSWVTSSGSIGDVRVSELHSPLSESAVCEMFEGSLADRHQVELSASRREHHRCLTLHAVVDLFSIDAPQEIVAVTHDVVTDRIVDGLGADWLLGSEQLQVSLSEAELKDSARKIISELGTRAEDLVHRYAESRSGDAAKARSRLRRVAARRRGQDDDDAEFQADWESRLDHASAQFKADGAQITLISATRELRPWYSFEFTIDGRHHPSGGWAIYHDLASGSVLSASCRSCGASPDNLVVGSSPCQHLLCANCTEAPPSCGHIVCKECSLGCDLCSRRTCVECAKACGVDECARKLCDRHNRKCASCGIDTCPNHCSRCARCRSIYCTSCVVGHNAQRAECGHLVECGARKRRCRSCGIDVCPLCALRCERCERYACRSCAGRCMSCQREVCTGCLSDSCDQCDAARTCKDHVVRCKTCRRARCALHSSQCAACDRFICASHTLKCRFCEGDFCPTHGGRAGLVAGWVWECIGCAKSHEEGASYVICSSCQSQRWEELLRSCGHCDQLACSRCRERCSDCTIWHCEWHLAACNSCCRLVCIDCLERHAAACFDRYADEIYDDEIDEGEVEDGGTDEREVDDGEIDRVLTA